MTMSALVTDHLPLVYALARKLSQRNPRFAFDDLVAAGTIGLCEAARRFRRGRGATFASFAWWRIKGAMIESMRQDGPYQRRDVEAHRKGGAPVVLVGAGCASDILDERPGAEEALAFAQEVAAARARIDAMEPSRRRLMALMYGPRELNLEQAGAVLGFQRSWACRLRAGALAALREAAEAA
jgi:RNA polymerase sigma factor (sigma-70 family)